MRRLSWLPVVVSSMVLASPVALLAANAAVTGAPEKLKTDDLVTPLGLDDSAPHFGWQLQDGRRGAKQSAYEVLVATKRELLAAGKADAWDSGKVNSDESTGVVYKGAGLQPSTRYYWRVLAWDREGKAYPAAESGWETGLLGQENWRAKWIGYERWEESAVRKAGAVWVTTADGAELKSAKPKEHEVAQQHIAYRLPFEVKAPVKQAFLFVTGMDVASAWVNGQQVTQGEPLPGWKQFPWKKYKQIDVTKQVRDGKNLLAVEITHYVVDPNGMASEDTPPMSATLLVQHADGSVVHFESGANGDWKASIHPKEGWTSATDGEASWKPVIAFVASPGGDGPPGNPWPTQTVKALRGDFQVHKPVASARLYVTALGAYQAFVNGKRAGDDVLSPGWTDYRLRLKYQTYDVTADVKQGHNALGALVAPGWYASPLMWFQQPNVFGVTAPSLMAQLRIQYRDGSVDWVISDGQWKADQSPILQSEIYDGENQDERLKQAGWNTAEFKDTNWKPVEVRSPDLSNIKVDGQDFQPICVEKVLTAKAVTEPKPGVYIFDMGQNFSGVERLRLSGSAGEDVQVRTGEILNADGTLYTDNLRTAKSTDHFILAGKGVEELEPQFTFHGYRYLELTGLKAKPALEAVRGVVFHTDAPFTAQLKTGSPMINQLWENILWGQRSNFVGVPTDCPQRDERLGWTADAQVFWRTATYNMDLAAFSRKYAADVRGTQVGSGEGTEAAGALFGIYAPGIQSTSSQSGAGWSDAGVIIPWTAWIQTGDKTVLEQNWEAMTKYLAAIERSNPDHLWVKNAGIGFGDWLSPEGPTTYPLVATAMWAYDVTLMQQMAHALGKADDEAKYAALFAEIKKAYVAKFVREDGFVAGAEMKESQFGVINNPDAKAKGGDTQTGYVLTLQMKLAPESLREKIAQRLVEKIEANHGLLGTGFLGTPYLLAVLTETGHRELAYHLLLNTQYPSWGYLVDHGATTMWERWNGDQMKSDPSMNSYNHYAYGAVADWLYRYAAGVDTTAMDAGFHTIYLHPAFEAQIGSLALKYPSPYGEIDSAWTVRDGAAQWTLTVPANAEGWLSLTQEEAEHYMLDGSPLKASKLASAAEKDGRAGYVLPAGDYSFTVSGVK